MKPVRMVLAAPALAAALSACADQPAAPDAVTTVTSTSVTSAPPTQTFVPDPPDEAAAQEWTARAQGAQGALAQVLGDMTTAVRSADFAEAAQQCRLTAALADALQKSLPAPRPDVDELFAGAAKDMQAATVMCESFKPGVDARQITKYAQYVHNAAKRLNASVALW